METITDTTKFESIAEQEAEVVSQQTDREFGETAEIRVNAVDGIKREKRKLYRMIDELSHDEIVAYGEWKRSL